MIVDAVALVVEKLIVVDVHGADVVADDGVAVVDEIVGVGVGVADNHNAYSYKASTNNSLGLCCSNRMTPF